MIDTMKLRIAAVKVGKSQRDLAEECNVSLTLINEIFTGKQSPRLSTVEKLCVALEIEDPAQKGEIFFCANSVPKIER